MRQYASEHSERWDGFDHRAGDIVVSTRSKCGTTWMQMICLLLVHQTPELPAPLAELSPWLDWDALDATEVRRRLAAQPHRRVIKTHTPLDGLPLDDRVTYVVVVRHPLDVAVSLLHHARNLDRVRLAELTGLASSAPASRTTREWIDGWIRDARDPSEELDTLPGNLHHLTDAWGRVPAGNVEVVHYEDLEADLDGSMRRLADRLGIAVRGSDWPDLVEAAGFASMQRRASVTQPAPPGILKDPHRFFRSGRSGDGRRACTRDQLDRYQGRVAELAAPEVADWLHRARPV